jgi:hypothetical protein
MSYIASSVYGNGASLGNGAFVVFNDTGSVVNITGLVANQNYSIKVIEYNAQGLQTIYSNRRALTLNTQTLPVEWLSFEGKQVSENEVLLNWTTASEVNNNFFEIQRGENAETFYKIDSIKANGNSNIILKYSFIDDGIKNLPSLVYYRLKQVDYDGKFSFSKTISVAIDLPWELDLIYPNPFESQITLKFKSNFDTPIKLQILNILGELKLEEFIDISNRLLVDVSTANLISGMYFLRLESGEYVKIYRIIRL